MIKIKENIKYDDFLRNNVLSNLKVNKDETWGVFFLNKSNFEENYVEKDLIVCDLKNFKTRVIDLSTKWKDYEFHGHEIILTTYADGYTEFYNFDICKNTIKLYIKVPYEVKSFSIDKCNIYFLGKALEPRECQYLESGTSIPLYEDSKGFIANSKNTLFEIDCKTKNISAISPANIDIDDISFELENHKIIFTAFNSEKFKPVESDVYTYNVETKDLKRWTYGDYRISYVGTLSRDKIIFLGINLKNKSRNDNHKLYVIELDTGYCRKIDSHQNKSNESSGVLSDIKFSISRPVTSRKDGFYFLTLEKNRVVLNRVDKEEEIASIDIGLNSIESYMVLKDKILAIGLQGLKLHELYSFEGGKLSQITNYNEWLIKEKNISVPKSLTIFTENVDIDGWVIPPIDVDENKSYPAILIIHGGPKLAFGEIYQHDMQMLAANGYYVFYANPIGSDGYGDEFLNIRGSFGNLPYDQLMEFTDKVVDKYPEIDKDRLGVMGISYGGYMTNYAIGKTTRFKAAVSESGISNLVTAFTSSDIGYQYILEYMEGETPWTNMEEYLSQSPITRAHKVETPTMFIHGKEDYRCSYTESINMYTAISFHGVETKLCIFDGESHQVNSMARPRIRNTRYKSILNWFNLYLRRE